MSDTEKITQGGGQILHPLEKEITQSYIDYSMSVIISRALPDTRDGLKPVVRRILFSMQQMGNISSNKHKKSATIVGDVMGKYHPHGDSSIYEAMVRLSQPWAMRYPLVDGQGNFGSIDGDGAAAMRYTEARMTKLAEEMLTDIDQDTVDWRDNFDGSLKEPIMVPTKFPNHLCNGTMGIAVGMATNMAPHNLTEVINACLLLIEKEGKKIDTSEMYIPAQKPYNTVLINGSETLFVDDGKGEVYLNKDLADTLKELDTNILVFSKEHQEKIGSLLEGYPFTIIEKNENAEISSVEFYKDLARIYEIEPSKTLTISDSDSDLDFASPAGFIHSIAFESTEQTLSQLKEERFGHKNDGTYSVSIDEIMEIIKGPDFPTGGTIFDSENIKEVYKKGKGAIAVRGKTHNEIFEGAEVIIIDEIPYFVNKSSLVAKIGELVVDKKIEGIADIRDESNKNKNRIAIYLKKGVDPDAILIQLYKFTELQNNFNINNVSLIDNGMQPRLLNIKDLLMEFITFRRQVVYRRSIFQLKKAKDRLHILDGLKKAIDIIDDVIATIRASESKKIAKENLIEKFDFSEEQAEYILMMRLQSLVGLEIQKIIDEIEEKKRLIEFLEGIINDAQKLDGVVIEEMIYIREKYGDERKTEVSNDPNVYNIAGSIKAMQQAADKVKEDVICRLGNDFSCRVLYQSRIQVIPDETLDLIYTHNQDKLIIITDKGELVVQRLKDFGAGNMAKQAINLKEHFGLKGKIVFAKTLHFPYEHLIFLTNQNSIKKAKKELVLGFKKFPTTIMTLAPNEKILKVEAVNDSDNVGIITKQGWMLLFKSADIRAMGKTAGGVKAIELQEGDEVSNMFLHKNEPFILIHSDKRGKLLSLEDLRMRKRARKGLVVMTGNDKLEGAISIIEGAIRIRFDDGKMETLHSNNIRLDEPETPLHNMVEKHIDVIYRPREEKEENLKYKDEKKKSDKDEKKQNNLFSEVDEQKNDNE